MTDRRAKTENRQLFFPHELRVALWYILEEEFPPAQAHWMGGVMGGEAQRLLEETVRKELNKLHLASGANVQEILQNFVIMLARPNEMVVVLESMVSVVLVGGPGLGLREPDRSAQVAGLKKRILGKLGDFGLSMMFTDHHKLVPKTVDVNPAVLTRLPQGEELTARLQAFINSHPIVSLLFLDVDGLKSINDRHGHDTGTACLARFVETMSPVVIGRGSIFRYGGDEFAIVLPNFDLYEAAATASRLRRSIEEAQIGDPRMTASIGVASSADERTALALIRHADAAAYASKFDGKNRVTTWPLDEDLEKRIASARRIAQGR
jgi:diguanylate cyclase (GGDEF)-like protein